MSVDSLDPLLARIIDNQVPQVEIGLAPGLDKPLPTAEESRLAGEAFAQYHPERDGLVNIVWLNACAMTLKDVLSDTFAPAKNTDEDEDKRKHLPTMPPSDDPE